MKPKEIFALAVRILGLWFLNLAINNFAMLFYQWKSWPYVVIDVLAAGWLISGARHLVNLAYPEQSGETKPGHEERTAGDTPGKKI